MSDSQRGAAELSDSQRGAAELTVAHRKRRRVSKPNSQTKCYLKENVQKLI